VGKYCVFEFEFGVGREMECSSGLCLLHRLCQSLPLRQKGYFHFVQSCTSFIILDYFPNRLGSNASMAHVKGTCSLTTNGIWLGYIEKWLGSKSI
jgi:hypothetical protein